jgi:hypothetical protein
MVGFGLTLSRLVGSVRSEIAPATVGGEGGRRSAAAAAMPTSRRVGQPMHVHGRVQGLRVEANVVLKFEEGRSTVGRTSELRPAATAGAEGRL